MRLEEGDDAGLEADKAHNLINQNDVVQREPYAVQLLARTRSDDGRRAGKLTCVFGHLRQPTITFSR